MASGGIVTADGGYYALVTETAPGNMGLPSRGSTDTAAEFIDGLTASVDVYLDTGWGAGKGFDYSVAANGTDGAHQRDFIFHVTKDTGTGQLLVGASNNAGFAPGEDLGVDRTTQSPAAAGTRCSTCSGMRAAILRSTST